MTRRRRHDDRTKFLERRVARPDGVTALRVVTPTGIVETKASNPVEHVLVVCKTCGRLVGVVGSVYELDEHGQPVARLIDTFEYQTRDAGQWSAVFLDEPTLPSLLVVHCPKDEEGEVVTADLRRARKMAGGGSKQRIRATPRAKQ